jgi:hypothetical protein
VSGAMALEQELGPLARLQGTWEGADGLDVSFNNARGELVETPFRERMVLNPFGPVENGRQVLYGLDYRTAAWRPGEEIPFHTEVGYWLWDAALGLVMRCFMVPRGSTVLAGGQASPADTTITMEAVAGSTTFGILSNPYLDENARTTHYVVTVSVDDDGSLQYDETVTVEHRRWPQPVAHVDRNRLRRVDA